MQFFFQCEHSVVSDDGLYDELEFSIKKIARKIIRIQKKTLHFNFVTTKNGFTNIIFTESCLFVEKERERKKRP